MIVLFLKKFLPCVSPHSQMFFIGDIDIDFYRSFSSHRETVSGADSFVDLDLVLMYLDLPGDAKQSIADGLGLSTQEICMEVEQMATLRASI